MLDCLLPAGVLQSGGGGHRVDRGGGGRDARDVLPVELLRADRAEAAGDDRPQRRRATQPAQCCVRGAHGAHQEQSQGLHRLRSVHLLFISPLSKNYSSLSRTVTSLCRKRPWLCWSGFRKSSRWRCGATASLGLTCLVPVYILECLCVQGHVQSTSDRAQFNDLQSHLCATLQVC